jgi:hypothetical protein
MRPWGAPEWPVPAQRDSFADYDVSRQLRPGLCRNEAAGLRFAASTRDLAERNRDHFRPGMVREGGLEPPHLSATEPKSVASTNFATLAWAHSRAWQPVQSGVPDKENARL